MNTSTLITRLLQLAARPFLLLFAFLKKVALAVFGRLQWSPPRWLSQSSAAFIRFQSRASPDHCFRDYWDLAARRRRGLDVALVPTPTETALRKRYDREGSGNEVGEGLKVSNA